MSGNALVFNIMLVQKLQQLLILSLLFQSSASQRTVQFDGECNHCVTLGIRVDSTHTLVNYTLNGSSLTSFRVKTVEECFTACIEKNCRCISFNFEERQDEKSESECILNYDTRHSNHERLLRKPGFTYYEIVAEKEKVNEQTLA